MHVPKRVSATLAFAAVLAFTSGCALQGPTDSPATGSLMVDESAAATVYVDGTARGAAGSVIGDLQAGGHSVKVVEPGGQSWSQDVVISAGETVSIAPDGSGPAVDPATLANDAAELADNNLLDTAQATGEEADPGLVPASRTIALDLVTADFPARDKLPQTTVPKSKWSSYGTYGPPAAAYPAPSIPAGLDPKEWKQQRVVAVAKKYLGLHYVHKHIPALGLDCSNFTAWVYNYGLGIRFTSSVSAQGASAGTKLAKGATLAVGDLLYFNVSGRIGHTGIYLGGNMMIDESTMNASKVAVKRFDSGWPKSHFAFARRVIN